MRLLILLVLLIGCSMTPKAPKRETPSTRCHSIFDAMCERTERCEDGNRQTCEDFFAGKVPMLYGTGGGIDVRAACDEVNYTNENAKKCADRLREPGCEWPPVCDNVVMGRRP